MKAPFKVGEYRAGLHTTSGCWFPILDADGFEVSRVPFSQMVAEGVSRKEADEIIKERMDKARSQAEDLVKLLNRPTFKVHIATMFESGDKVTYWPTLTNLSNGEVITPMRTINLDAGEDEAKAYAKLLGVEVEEFHHRYTVQVDNIGQVMATDNLSSAIRVAKEYYNKALKGEAGRAEPHTIVMDGDEIIAEFGENSQ